MSVLILLILPLIEPLGRFSQTTSPWEQFTNPVARELAPAGLRSSPSKKDHSINLTHRAAR
ncbi:hypothetical protein, partial [Pseudomonas sp. RGM2987]|uniref:hypothetical protein n=1 Tax=Pseudomonas sp. RGM2987 TaxID=2930090 RepID=UPI001FD685D9